VVSCSTLSDQNERYNVMDSQKTQQRSGYRVGMAENEGPEDDGPKLQAWKMSESKTTDHTAGGGGGEMQG